MAMVFHYLPFLLGAGLAALVLYCLFDGGSTRKPGGRERPRPAYHRRVDNSAHRD